MKQPDPTHWLCRLFGHDFRPRYSIKEENRQMDDLQLVYRNFDEGLRELTVLQHKTYHGDVCVKCGQTRKVS